MMLAEPSHEPELDLDYCFNFSRSSSGSSNDRGIRTASDSDWLEVNGNPTIPHVQSIRAPPAPIALHSKKDNMLGITNKNVSRRYLEKLQRDRERNQEVLAECIDNLPITIKQLVYPEKPTHKDPSGYSTLTSVPSRETKFRVGRSGGYWQQGGANQWVQDDPGPSDPDPGPGHQRKRNNKDRSGVRESSHHSKSTTDGTFLEKDYVHYPGFQGASGQSQSLRYKFGKKSGVASDTAPKPPPVKFKPKGYGSLYDELEFERRYKKVFDLNKHIHFVHSNYLSGQRLMKRNKLPPIGYNPSIHSDPMNGGDIFAIMSVQKYNHPAGESERTRQPSSNPGSGLRKSDGLYDRRPNRPRLEISQSLDTPIGFVPGTIPKTGSSPFDGINGNSNDMTLENLYRLQSYLKEEPNQTSRSHPDEKGRDTDSQHDQITKAATGEENGNPASTRKKLSRKQESAQSVDLNSEAPDDIEPFNIRVHVAIKPQKENEHSEESSERSAIVSPLQTNRSPRRSTETSDIEEANEKGLQDTFEEKIMYPTKLDSFGTIEHVHVDPETNTVTNITPRNIEVTTNQFGVVTKKVQYPPNFVIENTTNTDDIDNSETDPHHTNSIEKS